MSKWKSMVSQLCAIFPYICAQFSLGSAIGFQTILIAELYKKDSEIQLTLAELSWFASLDILKPIGTMITGFLMHRFGCQPLVLISALTYITSSLLYYYTNTAVIIFASRLLSAFLSVKAICNPYISEISEPKYRGTLLAISELSCNFGSFLSLLMGSLVYWRTVALLNVLFPILTAVTILLTPHSPTFLANKGRLDEAKKALRWLRGWVEPELVQIEFRALVKNARQSLPNADELSELGCDEAIGDQEPSKNFCRLYLQRSFLIPLGAVLLINLLYGFSGAATTEVYATVIFREFNSPIEGSAATAITGAIGVIGSLFIMIVIHRTGKRKLTFLSVIVTGFCQAAVATVGLLKLKKEYLWIPSIALFIAKFADTSGIGSIIFMLPAEIFPSSVRYMGTSISISARMILKSPMNKFFLYIVDIISLPGVFLFFAIVNFVALFVYYFLFPETEGRSLEEIEDDFRGEENEYRNLSLSRT